MPHSAPPATRPGQAGRLAPLFGWALLLALLVMQFFDLRDGIRLHPARWSLYLIGFSVLSLATLPWLVRRTAWTRRGLVMCGGFLVLLAYALVSSLVTPLPQLTRPHLPVHRIDLVVPVVTAMVTLLGAWGIAAAIGPERRPEVLWRASMLLAASTLLAGPRTILANHSLRLGTGMGGAAIYHVVLLLALGQLAGAALRGHRVRWSQAGMVVCLLGILLTGSRAGLVCLALFVAGLGLALASRGRARLAAAAVGTVLAAMVVVMAAVPTMRRLLQGHDAERAANYTSALHAVTASPLRLVLGVGSGRMWPWYPFETGGLPVPWKGVILSDTFGRNTTNPHSLVIGVLTELGLVGTVLLVTSLAVPVVALVRCWRQVAALAPDAGRELVNPRLASFVPLLAVVASMAAFLFDHYLFKNFAITFWWWFVVASLVGLSPSPAVLEEEERA